MRFKDRSMMTDLWVELDTPDGNKLRIPTEGSASSIAQLITLLDMEIKAFDKQGYNYTLGLSMQADKQKVSYRAYLGMVIENILCMRRPFPEQECYSDGIGDKIHTISGKMDRIIDSAPPVARAIARRIVKAATKIATGQSQKRMGRCEACGGRQSISASNNNLGRAGSLNAALRKKK